MPNCREIIHGTSLASTCWGNLAIRVYFQDAKGGIREFRNTWEGGTDYDRRFGARPQSPLAIAQWMNHDKGCVRVYCLDSDNVIQEHCRNDMDWFSGDLTKCGVVTAPYSKLAAVRLEGRIRIYYQQNDDTIREHCQVMGNWYPGAVLTTASSCKPLRGTSIASTSHGDNTTFVYFQDVDGGIREIEHKQQCSVSSVICQAKPYTPLAVVGWNDQNSIRLYYLSENNVIREYCREGKGWFSGALSKCGIVAAPCSKLAAVRWSSDGRGRIRVYYQPENDTNIHERCVNSGDWFGGAVLAVTQPNRSRENVPVDANGVSYPTGFIPWVLNHMQMRDYDPSKIDGTGMIIGFLDGRIVGEDLKTKRCAALTPNDDDTSYTWVYCPGHAIIYRLCERSKRGNYVHRSQPGSGKPSTFAGEFWVNPDNRIESWMAATDTRGEYNNFHDGEFPDSVVRKLTKLGIDIESRGWSCYPQQDSIQAVDL